MVSRGDRVSSHHQNIGWFKFLGFQKTLEPKNQKIFKIPREKKKQLVSFWGLWGLSQYPIVFFFWENGTLVVTLVTVGSCNYDSTLSYSPLRLSPYRPYLHFLFDYSSHSIAGNSGCRRRSFIKFYCWVPSPLIPINQLAPFTIYAFHKYSSCSFFFSVISTTLQ